MTLLSVMRVIGSHAVLQSDMEPSELPECGYIRGFRAPGRCHSGKDGEYEDLRVFYQYL